MVTVTSVTSNACNETEPVCHIGENSPCTTQSFHKRRIFEGPNNPTMETYFKQTNSLLRGETVPIGNYLIVINIQLADSQITLKMG